MTASTARRARFAVECLEGRAMMSATLAAAMPEPAEVRYELKNVQVSSVQPQLTKVGPGTLILSNSNSAGTHVLYQDIFIPANQSTHGSGRGGGAGKVSMRDFSFVANATDETADHERRGEIQIESFSLGATGSLDAMTNLAGIPVDDGVEAPVKAGYDLKVNKKV